MPRAMVTSMLTTSQVGKQFDMNQQQVIYWVEHGAFPPPTFIDKNGVRYFDQEWLRKAKVVLKVKGIID